MSVQERTAAARPSRVTPSLHKYAVFAAPIVVALLLVIVGGYVFHWSWTGYRTAEGPRPLWDWLTLALQPLTLAFVPVLLKLRHSRHEGWRVAAAVAALAFGVLVIGGYVMHWTWTGFTGNTLWEWLGLFLVPFLLPLVFVFLADLENAQRRPELEEGAPVRRPAETNNRAPSPRQRSLSFNALAVGSVVAVAAMAAAFSAGWLAHGRGLTSGQSAAQLSARTGGAAWSYPVTVSGTDPAWTDTGVRVGKGERVEISAFGLVRSSPRRGYPAVGPDGEPIRHNANESVVPGVKHEALLAAVGRPGLTIPLATSVEPRRVIEVGHHRVFDVPSDGELFLGVNDTGTGNNTGWFGATIRIVH